MVLEARTKVPEARTREDYGPRGQDQPGPGRTMVLEARTKVLEARTREDYDPRGQDQGGLWS